MPRTIQCVDLVLGQAPETEIGENLVERYSVQLIELGPGELAASHAFHTRVIAGTPGIGEFGAIDVESLSFRKLIDLTGHRRAPIDDSAEGIKDERLDRCD